MFERFTTDSSFERYTPKVLSRPNFVGNDTNETAIYQLGLWVLLLIDFVSTGTGAVSYRRTTKRRKGVPLLMHGAIQHAGKILWLRVLYRISMLTQIPHNNSEPLQLLQYEEDNSIRRTTTTLHTRRTVFKVYEYSPLFCI
jgi:hypothetical protein